MTPPLPRSTIDLVLTHLLPPSPLPAQILSQSLLSRQKYLPPSPNDLDAHLSPFPSSPSQPISSRLVDLTGHYVSYDPHYASDGEVVLARIVVISRVTHDGVQVLFEYEGGERGRGWVFHSAQLDEEETSLDWVEYAEDVPDPRALQHEDETGTEDYWAGFTPPVPMAEIRIGSATEAEEDYWAQYDVAGTIETPAGEINQAHAADAGQAKQHSSSAQIKVSSNDSILSQKLVSKITTLLRQAWSEFSEDARGQEDELEKKALDWLRVSRNVVQGDPRAGRMEEGEMLMRTKVDILWDMYGILYVDGEESRDGYWRLVEEAIRLPRGKETSEGETQPLYLQ